MVSWWEIMSVVRRCVQLDLVHTSGITTQQRSYFSFFCNVDILDWANNKIATCQHEHSDVRKKISFFPYPLYVKVHRRTKAILSLCRCVASVNNALVCKPRLRVVTA